MILKEGDTRELQRDPFARETLVRRVVTVIDEECSECGQTTAYYGRDDKLFRYGVSSDGGTEHWDPILFCSRRCRRHYYS